MATSTRITIFMIQATDKLNRIRVDIITQDTRLLIVKHRNRTFLQLKRTNKQSSIRYYCYHQFAQADNEARRYLQPSPCYHRLCYTTRTKRSRWRSG